MATLTPGLRAADAQVKANVNLPDVNTQTEVNHNRDLRVNATGQADLDRNQDKVQPVNKASGILGMEVQNRENQKLGEIKDLVLDLNSGKVSYAVLAVGGFLGLGEKLVALPPSSLHMSEDRQHLILNADKSRIQAAPGFAATAWPSVHNPEIDAFWKTEASGSPAGSEIRSNKKGADLDVDVNRDHKIYTDADKDHHEVKVKVNKD